jgi:hypothetical protein
MLFIAKAIFLLPRPLQPKTSVNVYYLNRARASYSMSALHGFHVWCSLQDDKFCNDRSVVNM